MEIDSVTSNIIKGNRRLRHSVKNYQLTFCSNSYKKRTGITYCYESVAMCQQANLHCAIYTFPLSLPYSTR
jgi:hypothetical protein